MRAGRSGDGATARQPWPVEVRVLGPLSVVRDGAAVDIPSRRQRSLLALLALNVGRATAADRLIDHLWDGAPPPQGAITLRSYVSNLRQVLGGHGHAVLVTRGQGYALDIPDEAVDAVRLRRLVREGRASLDADDASAALDAFTAALDLWQGDPLPEIAHHVAVRGTVLELTELHVRATEGRHEALLALGRHADAVPGLEALVADHPLREAPRELLMLALYRAGRAADALEVHRAYRDLLREEQGLDAGAAIGRLLQRILSRDPALDLRVPPAPTPAVRPPAAPHTSLVGRAPELEHLRAQVTRIAAGGPGGLVLLSGEAGIGKSALLDAAAAMAGTRGIALHAGRSPTGSGTPPYWPWTQVLTSMADSLGDEDLRTATAGRGRHVGQVVPAIAERAGPAAPVTGDDPALMRFLLHEAVVAFMAQALQGRPAVVLLDDLHLADPPSLELLAHLTPSLPALAVLVVASYRDAPASRSPALEGALAAVSREECVQELPLRGLSRDEVDSLAKQLAATSPLPTAPTEELTDLLVERTGGNPFLVRQLGRLLLDPGVSAADRHAVPPGIRHVMSSRLSALSPPALGLLEAASVVGRDFDLGLAATAADVDLPSALDAYDEAARHGLVEPTPGAGHRFVHALLQEAVLASLPPGRLVRLHAAVGTQLRSVGAPADRVAEHLWRARDLVGPAAVPHLVAAADGAAAMLAHEQAEQYLRRAAELLATSTPPDHERELTVLLKLFTLVAGARGWGVADAAAVAQRARTLAESVGLRDDAVRLWWSLWLYFLGKGDFTTTGELALTLARQVRDQDRSAARAVAHLMSVFRHLARPGSEAEALRELELVTALVEHVDAADLASYELNVAAMVHSTRAHVDALRGNVDGQRAAARRGVAVADADGRPSTRAMAHTLAAQTAILAGAPLEEVRTRVDAARQLADHYGYAYQSGQAAIFDLWVRAQTDGVHPEDVAALDRAVHHVVETGVGGTEAVCLCILGDVRALAGDAEGARRAYLEARAMPGANGQLMVDFVDRRLRR